MSYDYSIGLYSTIAQGGLEVGNITDQIIGYQDSTRANGGFWSGQFTLKPGYPIHMLEDWYNTFLGYRVMRSTNGLIMWDGLITQMRLTSHGQTWERDLSKMVNRAKVDYISTDGAHVSINWNTNTNSIAQFGQRDEIYTLDGADAALAASYRDTRLSEFGWPRSRGAGGELYNQNLANAAPSLQVMLSGFVFTMNWRFVVANTLLPLVNLSDFMTTLVNEAEFVDVGSIATNTVPVMGGFPTPMRVWDGIDKFVQCGDISGNRYIAQVGIDRKLTYKLAETAVTYLAIDGKVAARSGEILNAGEVEPNNIIQRTDSIPVTSLSTGIYDPRNCYIEQVDFIGGTVSAPSTCRIMTEDWTLADQLQGLLTYNQEIKRIEEGQRQWDKKKRDQMEDEE